MALDKNVLQQIMEYFQNGGANKQTSPAWGGFTSTNANTFDSTGNMSLGNTGANTDFMSNSANLGSSFGSDYMDTSGISPEIDYSIMGSNSANTPATSGSGGLMTDLFGGSYTDGSSTTGIVSPMAGLATGAMNAYVGLQKLNLAKDTLKFQKDSFSKQFENQRTLTNAQLRDRQIARDSATGRSTVGSYMKQNGV